MEYPTSVTTIPVEAARPAEIYIDLDALQYNLRQIRNYVGSKKILASVKGNAYGHGLIECARFLEECAIDYLGVAYVDEGIALRNAGIKTPILVLGGVLEPQIEIAIRNQLDLTASSIFKLEAISNIAQKINLKARVQLKIDTGMERIGVHYYNATKFLDAAAKLAGLKICGIFSHLALADEGDSDFTKKQLNRFAEVLEHPMVNVAEPIRHIANSAGMLEVPETQLDMVRVGLALYGATKSAKLSLKPVLSLRSRIVYLKIVPQGAGVSYGHRWKAKNDSRVVTIPIGYGDGYLRAYSNRAVVLIHGKRFPVIGSICMDQLMIDVGDEIVHNGEEVVLIGSQGSEEITCEELAVAGGTIPHEVLTALNLRIPRKYYFKGQLRSFIGSVTQ